MKRFISCFSMLLILVSCVSRRASSPISVNPEEMPDDLYTLPIEKDIILKDRVPSTIDLGGIRDGINWIYTPLLRWCFGYDEEKPGLLKIKSEDKLVSAQLVVFYYPTIWSDFDDNVIQLIEFSKLGAIGTRDIEIEDGLLVLNNRDLSTPPENVKKQVASITQQDLLSALDDIGTAFEFENWSEEKKVWKGYISKYIPGDFVDLEKEENRFGTYPNKYYLQVQLKGKDGKYFINLCDRVIIGN